MEALCGVLLFPTRQFSRNLASIFNFFFLSFLNVRLDVACHNRVDLLLFVGVASWVDNCVLLLHDFRFADLEPALRPGVEEHEKASKEVFQDVSLDGLILTNRATDVGKDYDNGKVRREDESIP